MTRTCPDCGSPVDYASRTAVVLEGSCSGCGHVITVVQGAPGHSGPAPGGPVIAAGAEGGPAGAVEESGWSGPRPACTSCGEPITFHLAGPGVQGVCSGCGRASGYLPEGTAPPEFRPRREPRFEGPSGGREGYPAARARPCRECGGPLRFSTGADGTISGECAQCGNRFSLPPRRESSGGRGGGGRRFDRGPGPRFGRGGPPRRYGGPPRNSYGGRERREGREDDEEDRPRRRPRRE
jgi:hypothetical protein